MKSLKLLLAGFPRLLVDERGVTAVIFALLLPFILGGVALGVETGYWFTVKNTLQSAADVAAYSVGVGMRRGDPVPALEMAASRIATRSGFNPAYGEVRVNIPPLVGDYKGNSDYAEVVLSEHRDRLFSALFVKDPVEISTRSVVTTLGGEPLCVLALSEDSSNALHFGLASDVSLDECGAASNSSSGSSISSILYTGRLSAKCVQTVGGFSMINTLGFDPCAGSLSGAASAPDPYQNLHEINLSGIPCTTPPASAQGGGWGRNGIVIDGMLVTRFCGDVVVRGRHDLPPGVYVIEAGTLRISTAATITGSGVSLLMRNGGALQISNANVTLSAPTTGPFKGVLMASSRENSRSHEISLLSNSSLSGAIYMPSASLSFSGGWTSHCIQLVANTIHFSGQTRANANCANGTRSLMAGQTVAVVE